MSRLLLFLYAAQAIAAVDFARDVEPILTARCHGCHGERTQMKGLRLDNRDDALRVLSPGKSAESLLLRMVSGTEENRVMPPAGARLTSTEIARLREWIDEGAVWPKVTAAAPAKNGHWSFQCRSKTISSRASAGGFASTRRGEGSMGCRRTIRRRLTSMPGSALPASVRSGSCRCSARLAGMGK